MFVYVHRGGGQRSAAGVLQAPSHPPCFSETGSLTDLVRLVGGRTEGLHLRHHTLFFPWVLEADFRPSHFPTLSHLPRPQGLIFFEEVSCSPPNPSNGWFYILSSSAYRFQLLPVLETQDVCSGFGFGTSHPHGYEVISWGDF